ncbi:MAG: 2-amino-4-hydroxy-6-hydroxymethyldihydropteridine diphosphokinase [Oscillospiraceae bacterium]|jgi:2-amino-4-hydroxy-6-hydroxymethyldihydropteridine diphosphokinase|nr:2-amino-4-hydroxy-6-hydroxymethyldihydropteridine diphosphokinase [Oscillospiraceae bacterium]
MSLIARKRYLGCAVFTSKSCHGEIDLASECLILSEKFNEAVLALGSNMNERGENIVRAVEVLSKVPIVNVKKISRVYETEPYGVPVQQENFLNCCLKISTNLSERALLGVCLGIEVSLGRERPYRFASRIIDIDLICYESCKINTAELCLPHSRAKDRPFVIAPMHDLYPGEIPEYFGFESEMKKIDDSYFENIFSYDEIIKS